jgi:hypothetical protein
MTATNRLRLSRRRARLVGSGVGLWLAAAPAWLLTGAGSPVAFASSAGDDNRGDVWVDNTGQPSGPGHEMDPHLQCRDINLWGNGLADSRGVYTVDGWPPSGAMEQDYPTSGSGHWSYNTARGGSQVIDVIRVKTLVEDALRNGDTPQPQQGLHFKLQLSQDPQKHKTFWVDCPAPSSNPTPPPTNPPTSSGPPTGTTTSIGAITQSIGATRVMRCRHGMIKRTKRVHGQRVVACVAKKKRHAVRRHRHAIVRRRDLAFTG